VQEQDTEIRKRVCRGCNESYDYPVPRSPATRFYCDSCAELPAEVRAILEKYNKRIKAMAAQIEKLEQRCKALEGK
jgi:chaperonin cofactor prefoldin